MKHDIALSQCLTGQYVGPHRRSAILADSIEDPMSPRKDYWNKSDVALHAEKGEPGPGYIGIKIFRDTTIVVRWFYEQWGRQHSAYAYAYDDVGHERYIKEFAYYRFAMHIAPNSTDMAIFRMITLSGAE